MTKSYTFLPELYTVPVSPDRNFGFIKCKAMKHEYKVSGMTCEGCAASVQNLIKKVPGVKSVNVSLEDHNATIEMDTHIPLSRLKQAFEAFPKYSITEIENGHADQHHGPKDEDTRTFWETYKPILILFTFLTGVTLLVEFSSSTFHLMRWMNNFMAGFFLVFSFFKLLDLAAFASSYSTYDVVARKWYAWGYIYPFVELILGVLFLTNFHMLYVNAATLVVMGVSSVGVVQSLVKKRKIRCACLGAVFNFPMSSITLVEDLLMVGMSGLMILYHL